MDHLFSFKGRSSRAEWWSAQWIQTPICFAMMGIFFVTLTDPEVKRLVSEHVANGDSSLGVGWLMISSMSIKMLIPFVLLFVLSMWIWLASHTRRLHDHNMSGKSFFLMYIPFVATYMEYKLALAKGKPGKNDYGGSVLDTDDGGFNTYAADELIFERLENRGGYKVEAPSTVVQETQPQTPRTKNFKFMKRKKPKPLFGD